MKPLDSLQLLRGCEFNCLQEPAVKGIGAHGRTSEFSMILPYEKIGPTLNTDITKK